MNDEWKAAWSFIHHSSLLIHHFFFHPVYPVNDDPQVVFFDSSVLV